MMKNRLRRCVLGGLIVAAILPWVAAQAAELQLADLMQVLAQNKAGRATFVEKKYIGIVEKPLESSGELSYVPPDRLEKRTLKPVAESIAVDGKVLTIERAGKQRLRLNLADYPEVAAFIDSIRGTLSGDRAALEAMYQVSLSGGIDKWVLMLRPRYSRMSDVVSQISIRGTRAELSRIDFNMADGDRSEMSLTSVPQP
jgi:outer membrane lipoprotein-sorting protein